MGLDMYLEADKHISGYSFYKPEEQKVYNDVVDTLGVREFVDPDTPSGSVTITVGYWRKANQIHKWFVENVQSDNDDCGRYYVVLDKLVELKEACQLVVSQSELIDGQIHTGTVWSSEHPKGAVQLAEGKIVKDPTVAHKLLPTQSGFFFGGTDYDEWYINDLTRTIAIVDRALKLPKEDYWSLYYTSSW